MTTQTDSLAKQVAITFTMRQTDSLENQMENIYMTILIDCSAKWMGIISTTPLTAW